jgi:magnesium-transporting ATPase (P-type)
MYFRALLAVASGFIFIFSPGLPMNLISRHSPEYKRDLVYWGIGAWLVTGLISQFVRSLIRPLIYQEKAVAGYTGSSVDYLVILLTAFLSALFLGIGMLFVLRYKKKKEPKEDVVINGLALGFGAGLIAQVFTGITLVGAGFQVLFGNTESNITVSAIAKNSLAMVLISMITLIVFRIALLAVSAVQGVLTARGVEQKKGQFWAGVVVHTLFTSLILAVQLLMGEVIPGQVTVGLTPVPVSIVTSLYYLLAFSAAYVWLTKQLTAHKK